MTSINTGGMARIGRIVNALARGEPQAAIAEREGVEMVIVGNVKRNYSESIKFKAKQLGRAMSVDEGVARILEAIYPSGGAVKRNGGST